MSPFFVIIFIVKCQLVEATENVWSLKRLIWGQSVKKKYFYTRNWGFLTMIMCVSSAIWMLQTKYFFILSRYTLWYVVMCSATSSWFVCLFVSSFHNFFFLSFFFISFHHMNAVKYNLRNQFQRISAKRQLDIQEFKSKLLKEI